MMRLEQEILQEYEATVTNLAILNQEIHRLNSLHIPMLAERMREAEQKFATAYTLFKTAVFNTVGTSETNRPSL